VRLPRWHACTTRIRSDWVGGTRNTAPTAPPSTTRGKHAARAVMQARPNCKLLCSILCLDQSLGSRRLPSRASFSLTAAFARSSRDCRMPRTTSSSLCSRSLPQHSKPCSGVDLQTSPGQTGGLTLRVRNGQSIGIEMAELIDDGNAALRETQRKYALAVCDALGSSRRACWSGHPIGRQLPVAAGTHRCVQTGAGS